MTAETAGATLPVVVKAIAVSTMKPLTQTSTSSEAVVIALKTPLASVSTALVSPLAAKAETKASTIVALFALAASAAPASTPAARVARAVALVAEVRADGVMVVGSRVWWRRMVFQHHRHRRQLLRGRRILPQWGA